MLKQSPHIRPFIPEDLQPVHELVTAAAEEDQIDPNSTLENVPSQQELQKSLENSADVVVVSDHDTGEIIGYGSIRWWQEDDGTFVYFHEGKIHPQHRRQGTGDTLLTKLQERIREVATMHPKGVSKVYATNATELESGTKELLQKNDYKKVWSSVEMELADIDGLEKINPPEGYELRDITTENDRRAVYNANKEIYKGEFGSSTASEKDYQEFLDDNPDTSLWQVLWCGDEIAGFVLSKPKGNVAEIMEVSVMPKFRRRGLGKYLMMESMMRLRDGGTQVIRLHTDAEGKKGGRQLYEAIGFSALKEHYRYRKPLE